jgi:hypothetical protein
MVTPNSIVRMIVSATIDGGQAVTSAKGHLGGVGEAACRSLNRHPPRPHLTETTRHPSADIRQAPVHSRSRRATYELTARGEQRLDDRFLGQLSDEYQSPQFDFSQALQPLTRVVADLNAHAPVIAELLYPGLDVLKDHVYDQGLRSAAMGELSESYQNMPTAGTSEPPLV